MKTTSLAAIALCFLFSSVAIAKVKPTLVHLIGGKQTHVTATGFRKVDRKKKATFMWCPKVYFFVKYDNIEPEDAVSVQLLNKKMKKMGQPFTCKPKHLFADLKLSYGNKKADSNAKQLPMAQYECGPSKDQCKQDAVAKLGNYHLSFTYKKPTEGEEIKDFARLGFKIVQALHGWAKHPEKTYAVDNDFLTGLTTIEEFVFQTPKKPADLRNAQIAVVGHRHIEPKVMIRTWFKYDSSPKVSKIICKYKGKRIAQTGPFNGDEYSFMVRPKDKKANDLVKVYLKRFDFRLENVFFRHPREEPKKNRRVKKHYKMPKHYLSENPGEYKCMILGESELLRVVHFKIGGKGKVISNGCNEAIAKLPHVSFIKTEEKKGDYIHKAKLKASPRSKNTAFYMDVKWPKGCPNDI